MSIELLLGDAGPNHHGVDSLLPGSHHNAPHCHLQHDSAFRTASGLEQAMMQISAMRDTIGKMSARIVKPSCRKQLKPRSLPD